jgi:hypothetical protein
MDNLKKKTILCFQGLVQFKIGKNLVYGDVKSYIKSYIEKTITFMITIRTC